MSFVVPHRVDDKIVGNFYEKVSTQGDASDFTGEDPGRRSMLNLFNAVGVIGSFTSFTFTLPFSYLVNQNQLMVYWEQTDNDLPNTSYPGWGLMVSKALAETIPTFDFSTAPHYEETTSNTVVIHNAGNLTPSPFTGTLANTNGNSSNSFLFLVPHTALSGNARNRVVVENQGDNVAVELQGAGDGIAFTTPEGRKFLIRPEEEGVITAREIS